MTNVETPTPEVEKPGRIDLAVKPIEDAGSLNSSLMITFLLLCLYFVIAVASTTHRLLLLGGALALPLLDVAIPVEGFYVVAPVVIVGLHVYLLLQYYVLSRRLRDPLTAGLGKDADFFLFPALPVLRHVLRKEDPAVSAFIRAGLVFFNIVFPVLVLCLAQYYFLPYHHKYITLLHQLLIVADLAVSFYFFVIVPSLARRRESQQSQHGRMFLVRAIFMACFAVPILAFSWALAIIPETGIEGFRGKPFPFALKLTRNLRLTDQLLIGEAPSQEVVAAFAERGDKTNFRDIYLRFAVGADLSGRDLRGADLEQAKLFNADLRGADLRGAWLVGADLSGANLNPQEVGSRLLHEKRGAAKSEAIAHLLAAGAYKPTRLDGANAAGANFFGAKMILVSMVQANLQGVELLDVELTGADLRRARLSDATLAGSDLSYANLEGATMNHALLSGAIFDYAFLDGASLTSAQAIAASFVNASLEGAQLAEAELAASAFLGANLAGSDLRNANLQGATDLKLGSLDLRGAQLGTAYGVRITTLVDLRFVDFGVPSPAVWEGRKAAIEMMIEKKMEGMPQEMRHRVTESFHTAYKRISASVARSDSQTVEAQARSQLLYFDEQLTKGGMENWPLLDKQSRGKWNEELFHRALAEDLLGRVCTSPGLARALIFRAAGESSPGDQAFDMEVARQIAPKLEDLSGCPAVRELLSQISNRYGIDLVRQIAWRVREQPF